MTEMNLLMKAINLADLDNLKEVEITMKDLRVLTDHIRSQKLAIAVLQDKNNRLDISLAQSELKSIEKPIKLSVYC